MQLALLGGVTAMLHKPFLHEELEAVITLAAQP